MEREIGRQTVSVRESMIDESTRSGKREYKDQKNYVLLGCTEGEVRLVGGTSDNEGTVEICHNKLWGLITDAGWDNKDAKVICRQLNLPVRG